MTDVQRRIAALSPHQRELLEARLADLAAARDHGTGDRITPRDRSLPAPLAIQQQREWTFAQFRSANNIPGAFRVEGKLDLELLGRVLTEVVERHEVLRSTVELQPDGSRVQTVHPATPVPVPIVDLSRLSDEQQRARVRARLIEEVETPFDPGGRQRLRICLFRLAEQTHVVFITTDHAAADLFSVGILVREFAALYAGVRLEPLEIQFGDFAVWQRTAEEKRRTAEIEHWRRTLAGASADSALPADRPFPTRPTFAGATHHAVLSPELFADLQTFGESENATFGVLLIAASAVLLHRYTGREDIVIGENVPGRNRTELESLVGCFVGALPMRVRMSDGDSLREVVRQAREIVVTAYDHQDLPVDAMLDQLDLGPDVSPATLIDLWLDIRTPATMLEVPGLRITPETVESSLAPAPLTLDIDPYSDPVRLQWIYLTEMFDAGTVQLFAEQFERVLRQLVTAPDTTVGEADLIHAPAPVPVRSAEETGFVELFQQRVALAPHAPAVLHDGVPTSYDELNRAANRLARQLRARGVGAETSVGILLDRSPRLAVAILGVLKAGGAYVPLDSAYPPDRIAGMLADAGATVLVTEQRLASMVAAPPASTVLMEDLVDGADDDLPQSPDLGSPAYVVYTSGSTGRPKGAVIEHRSLITYARDVVERIGLGAGDRFLQFASPSFDVLVEELFPTWLAGGCVVIPAGSLLDRSEDLAELIEHARITVVELPTAYWHEWVRELDRRDQLLPDCLRLVIIGGEPVLPDRLERWRRLGVALMNCYGLTETTVTSTFFRIDPAGPSTEWPNLPIGTPLPSACLHVLDDRLRPVPAGGTGELYIGGVSVGRGYLGRPGSTAQRFVADPFRPGRRLYRTGDLIRQRADGNLEFVSRVDRQVKIRGFRVEPTEIESALSRHPGVAETVVSVHEPARGDRRLVAYVVPAPDGAAGVAELRRYLGGELPAYLVPSAFVELDALPLSPNGKVDHGRLPPPEESRPALAAEYVAPQSPVQQQLAGIVSAVVGVEEVGIHDNFFEIGGDSILAIQIASRAREAGLRLSPQDLFEHATVADLAEAAGKGPAADAEQGDVTGPVPLGLNHRWFATVGITQPHHWNRSVTVELPGAFEPALVEAAVEHLMNHHDGLRLRLLLAGERTQLRIAQPGDRTPFAAYDLSGIDEPDLDRAMAELYAETQTGLDLAVGPLARFALIHVGGGRPDRIAIVAHRLVADVTSMRILVEDLRSVLAQLTAGEKAALPQKTTSWQSWMRRLIAYRRTPHIQSQRAYWSDLVGAPAGALPVDRPVKPAADTVAAEQAVDVALGAEETTELFAVLDNIDCRIEEVLLTALGRTLSWWDGAGGRHLVDVERHDRVPLFEDVDLSRTVGWISQTHPVALTAGQHESPEATLKAVKDALRTVADNGVGWQLLRSDPEPVPPGQAELAFSYLGERGPEGLPADRSPLGQRPYAVEVEVAVAGAALRVRWRYSASRHDRQTVHGLADRFLSEVRSIVEAARHMAAPPRTPSDFPLARIDQAQLDDLLSQI